MAQGRKLPKSLKTERRGPVAIVTLARPEKRNALNDTTVLGMETFFATLPAAVKAVVLNAEGNHFSAGLDLSELKYSRPRKASRIRASGIGCSTSSSSAVCRSSP